jgi:hypothetical protein
MDLAAGGLASDLPIVPRFGEQPLGKVEPLLGFGELFMEVVVISFQLVEPSGNITGE